MDKLQEFERRLSPKLRALFHSLDSPAAIQSYLDSLPYIAEDRDRSPLEVLQDGQAHCLDGGFFAALALRRIGYPPLVLDLAPEPDTDDDHVLALFRRSGAWGAVAKSNYVGLRFREPVYRSLRELAMSYFEWYHNLEKRKTLRGYTRPLDLTCFDSCNWMWDEADIRMLVTRLYSRTAIPLISDESVALLSPVDERLSNANTQGTDFNWVFGVRSNP